MSIMLDAIPVPLRDDGQGGLRIGNTRVTLESVLYARQRGESAEEIVSNFDVLDLADVYAVLSWALRHPEQASVYLDRRRDEAAATRRQSEALGIARTPEESAKFREVLHQRLAKRGPQFGRDDAPTID